MSENVHLLLQVHDELLFEMEESVIGDIVPKICQVMEGVIPPKEISGIVLKADASVGDNWNDLEKIIDN